MKYAMSNISIDRTTEQCPLLTSKNYLPGMIV